MRFIATIYFDADNDADARDLMVSWGLPEGSTVTAQASPDPVTITVGPNGSLDIPPAITTLDPASAAEGDPDVTLRVLGTGFDEATIINWNGGDEVTKFVSSQEVTTIVKTSGVEFDVTPGVYPVYVHNPIGTSNTVSFEIAP
jgi:hypothetical protein